MSNTNTRGRLLVIGGMVQATITISSDWQMPEFYMPHNPSWQELNKGKRSKRQRRK